MDTPADVTAVLQAVRDGNPHVADQLFGLVYGELHRLASARRRRWGGNETLNTTALVHEAYLKLVRQDADWECRAHFFAVAAEAMRQILINYAERQLATKRGAGAVHVPLGDADLMEPEAAEELLALNEALSQLARVHERASRVVECRFFGGFGIRETAEALSISRATVERDWTFASAWLRRALSTEVEVVQ